jgi:20S proteasome alpha/beta subunit
MQKCKRERKLGNCLSTSKKMKLVCLIFGCFYCLLSHSSIFYITNISRNRNKGRTRYVMRSENEQLDARGRLPIMENTTKALELYARPIVILKTLNNSIAIGYVNNLDEKENGERFQKPLKVPIKLDPVTLLSNTSKQSLYLVSTGVSSDCYQIYKYTQSLIANHTFMFGSSSSSNFSSVSYTSSYDSISPSVHYLTRKLSSFLWENFLIRGKRLLISHSFLISIRKTSLPDGSPLASNIYEILPNGDVNEIIGGVAGKVSKKNKSMFENSYHSQMSEVEVMQLIQNVFKSQEDIEDSNVKNPKFRNDQVLIKYITE